MADKKVRIAGRDYCAGSDDYTTPAPAAKDKFGSKADAATPDYTTEHQKIKSRVTGREHEIGFGPLPGGLVPSNPFASIAQQGYLHAHPEKLGKAKLAEFDAASKGLKLPKRVKKSK